MSGHTVTYIVDGRQYSRAFDYSSTKHEACKMAELSEKWKNLNCNFRLVSVEDIEPSHEICNIKSAKQNSKNCFLFRYDGRDRCK
jgi:hypothetical protein